MKEGGDEIPPLYSIYFRGNRTKDILNLISISYMSNFSLNLNLKALNKQKKRGGWHPRHATPGGWYPHHATPGGWHFRHATQGGVAPPSCNSRGGWHPHHTTPFFILTLLNYR